MPPYHQFFNGPASGGATVTLAGMNFAPVDVSATVKVGFSVCATTSWSSVTILSCTIHSGYGQEHDVAVTMSAEIVSSENVLVNSNHAGTAFSLFSYDGTKTHNQISIKKEYPDIRGR